VDTLANQPSGDDFVIDQNWTRYDKAGHAIWRDLFLRQSKMLPGRACNEFLQGSPD